MNKLPEVEEFSLIPDVTNKVLTVVVKKYEANQELRDGLAGLCAAQMSSFQKVGFTKKESMKLLIEFMRIALHRDIE